MTNVRRGSHVYLLLRLLAVTGEIPMKIVHLLGSERSWKELIYKLSSVQEIRIVETNERFKCRLLTIGGKGKLKTIRLYKAALPILEKIDPWAYEYYMDSFGGHHFSGDDRHIERNHRVAEAMIACMRAGIKVYQPGLPDVLGDDIQNLSPSSPCFYVGRDLKKLDVSELNKTKFTRIVGLLVSPGECRAVYNCRDKPMEWLGQGERKARQHLSDILKPGPSYMIYSAILFGLDMNIALQTLEKAYKSRRFDLRFDGIYPYIHFVPLNEFGVRFLKILTVRNWQEKILEMLFHPRTRLRDREYGIEMDAYDGNNWFYSFLDGNLARLIRLKEDMKTALSTEVTIICYPEQEEIVQQFLRNRVRTQLITLEKVEHALGLIKDEEES